MSEYVLCERTTFRPGEIVDGRYTVDKLLGEGTFGRVYKVHNSSGTYALKLLKLWEVLVDDRPKLLKRFDREFETGKISSNYLVHALSKGTVKGNPYILMEFCTGGDLLTVAESGIDIDMVGVACNILYGLKDLHTNGKIHRDLKPENVLLRGDGCAVLTDFGIAGDQNNRLTRMGILGVPLERFGTYAYMPPEQINPPRNRNATVLATTDIFSFGVMMYQLLTGELPFGRLKNETDLARYTANGKNGRWNKEKLRKEAPEWCRVIEGCLKPKMTDRAQNVDEVLTLIPHSERKKKYRRDASGVQSEPQLKIVNGVLLRIMEGEDYGKTYLLDSMLSQNQNAKILTIGRRDEDVYNRISITENESSYVSRCHCTLELDYGSGRWLIRDGQARVDCPIAKRQQKIYPCPGCTARCNGGPRHLEWLRSLNGTFVNSSEVDSNGTYVTPGDIISIGDVKIRVEGY